MSDKTQCAITHIWIKDWERKCESKSCRPSKKSKWRPLFTPNVKRNRGFRNDVSHIYKKDFKTLWISITNLIILTLFSLKVPTQTTKKVGLFWKDQIYHKYFKADCLSMPKIIKCTKKLENEEKKFLELSLPMSINENIQI